MDDLDSKMEAMRAQFERDGVNEAAWTGYNPSLGRPLLNVEKFLQGKSVDSSSVEESTPASADAPSPEPSLAQMEFPADEPESSTVASNLPQDKT